MQRKFRFSCNLHVAFCNSVCAVEFTVKPEDVVARAGDMAMMACEYITESGTQGVVEWDFEGTSILANDPPCGCSIDTTGTLHFNNITAQDAGEYKCVVTLNFQSHECPATLRLEGETHCMVFTGGVSVCGGAWCLYEYTAVVGV